MADGDRPAVEAAIADTGGVLLALSVVAATIRSGATWVEVTDRLRALAHVYGGHPYADVFKTTRIAVDHLAPLDADRYLLLGVFPEDVTVPHATIGRLWNVEDPHPTLTTLADAGLLTMRGDEGVRFHDLQRSFLIFAATEPWALLHRHLLDRHRPPKGWAYLPDDEPYLWDHLLDHLHMAGEHHEMVTVVTNGRWLVRRLHRDGVYPTEVDLAHVAAVRPHDATVGEELALVRRWSGLFQADLPLRDLAATVISRLPSAEPEASDLLGEIWLKPAWPLPDAMPALRRTLTGHTGGVTAVAFAPDGHTLATTSGDGHPRTGMPQTKPAPTTSSRTKTYTSAAPGPISQRHSPTAPPIPLTTTRERREGDCSAKPILVSSVAVAGRRRPGVRTTIEVPADPGAGDRFPPDERTLRAAY